MRYARVDDEGVVAEIITPPGGTRIEDMFSAELSRSLYPVGGDVAPGWLMNRPGKFEAPPPPPETGQDGEAEEIAADASAETETAATEPRTGRARQKRG